VSGRRSRSKGYRREREVVLALRAVGIDAQRVPLSGAAQGEFAGDVVATIDGETKQIEVKARADGWRTIRGWLDGNDALILIPDRDEPLVVERLSTRLRDWSGGSG
tara:strand:- start:61 stop:378 length:318 start_codon:yes stop_codon:yes gene_type:complete